jgi:asparagine synthase (glutamine-hydrolysing)
LKRLLGPAVTNGTARLVKEFAAYPGTDPVNQLLFVDALTYLPDDILHITDRMSMAVSLEARTPFLDYRLVEFSFALPGRFKMNQRARTWKLALKDALGPLLPPEILQRPKWGFGGPVKEWMQGGLEALTRDMFQESRAVQLGLLDGSAIHRYLASSDRLTQRRAQRLWSLLVLEVWCRVFTGPGRIESPTMTLREMIA